MSTAKYWQCPNDESHTLKFGEKIYGTHHWRQYCTVCVDTVAVFRSKPSAPSGEPPQSAREWLDEHVPLQFTGSDDEPKGTCHIDKDGMSQLLDAYASECVRRERESLRSQSMPQRSDWREAEIESFRKLASEDRLEADTPATKEKNNAD